jgi:hypothetical protein
MGGFTEAVRLLDVKTLRALLLALRRDVRHYQPPSEPDPALVELLDRPFESIPGVFERLSRLETRLLAQDDRRAVFLSVYVRMTEQVHEGLRRGVFSDPEWMRRYLITFADYYRRAFLAFERGNIEEVSDPWRIAFGAAGRGDSLIIQDALLGVNAHINYDLAFALNDIGIDPDRPGKYADHRAINDILAHLVDIQQEALVDLYAEGVADIDMALGRFDESLSLLSMTQGREQAWRIAAILADARVPPITSYARWVVRTTATGSAFVVLSPTVDPSFRAALRRVETDGLSLETICNRITDRLDEASIPTE